MYRYTVLNEWPSCYVVINETKCQLWNHSLKELLEVWSVCYKPLMTFTCWFSFWFFSDETIILYIYWNYWLFPELMTWSQTIKVCLTGWQLGYQKQTTYKLSMAALNYIYSNAQELYILCRGWNKVCLLK